MARRLRGDKRFEMQKIDQPRFHELRLGEWRGYAKDGLVSEKNGPFRHRVHVAGEAEGGEIL